MISVLKFGKTPTIWFYSQHFNKDAHTAEVARAGHKSD